MPTLAVALAVLVASASCAAIPKQSTVELWGTTYDTQSTLSLIRVGQGLSGALPGPTLAQLTNLGRLNLQDNSLTGLPTQLGLLEKLTTLELSNNPLAATIPTQVGALTRLRVLRLDSAQLSGTLPSQMGALSALRTLSASSNELGGTLLPAFGAIALSLLDLGNNMLEGSVPAGLFGPGALWSVDLSHNLLTGPFPESIGNATDLVSLDISYNLVRSALPTSVASLASVLSFRISHTLLSFPDTHHTELCDKLSACESCFVDPTQCAVCTLTSYSQSATPTVTATASQSPTVSLSGSVTLSVSLSASGSVSSSPSLSPSGSRSSSPTPSATASPLPSPESVSPTSSPESASPSPSPESASASPSPTPSPVSASPTPSPVSASPSPSPTPSPESASPTSSPASASPTPSPVSASPSPSPTPSPESASPTPSPESASPTPSPESASPSPSPTPSPESASPTSSPASASASPSRGPDPSAPLSPTPNTSTSPSATSSPASSASRTPSASTVPPSTSSNPLLPVPSPSAPPGSGDDIVLTVSLVSMAGAFVFAGFCGAGYTIRRRRRAAEERRASEKRYKSNQSMMLPTMAGVAAGAFAVGRAFPVIGQFVVVLKSLNELYEDMQDTAFFSHQFLRWIHALCNVLIKLEGQLEDAGRNAEDVSTILYSALADAEDLLLMSKSYSEKGKLLKFVGTVSFKARLDRARMSATTALQALQVGLDSHIIDQNNAVFREVNMMRMKMSNKELVDHHRRSSVEASEISPSLVRFLNEDSVGKGAQGVVYKAEYQGARVAVKCMSLEGMTVLQRQDVIDNFNEEVALLCTLRNPNIVNFYGVMTSNPEELVMVMDLAELGDLRTFLNKGHLQLSDADRVALLLDIAYGLQYLHKMNVQHRDMKSLNCLLSRAEGGRPRAKIADFGLSRQKVQHVTTLAAHGPQGSQAWMAPECIEGYDYTFASDVYSFGVVIFEVATGAVPFDSVPPVKAAVSVTQGKRPLDEVDVSVQPPALKDLMELCWKQDPDQRPTIESVVRTLEELRRALPHAAASGSVNTFPMWGSAPLNLVNDHSDSESEAPQITSRMDHVLLSARGAEANPNRSSHKFKPVAAGNDQRPANPPPPPLFDDSSPKRSRSVPQAEGEKSTVPLRRASASESQLLPRREPGEGRHEEPENPDDSGNEAEGEEAEGEEAEGGDAERGAAEGGEAPWVLLRMRSISNRRRQSATLRSDRIRRNSSDEPSSQRGPPEQQQGEPQTEGEPAA